jgi:hypothetical protein
MSSTAINYRALLLRRQYRAAISEHRDFRHELDRASLASHLRAVRRAHLDVPSSSRSTISLRLARGVTHGERRFFSSVQFEFPIRHGYPRENKRY